MAVEAAADGPGEQAVTLTYVLMQNLKRNRLRSALTAVAFALPMAVFMAAISLLVGMQDLARENQRQLRLAVHHKTSISNMLPAGMRGKIQVLDPAGDRITAICGMRWFGGACAEYPGHAPCHGGGTPIPLHPPTARSA